MHRIGSKSEGRMRGWEGCNDEGMMDEMRDGLMGGMG